jgi:hypothetical protein
MSIFGMFFLISLTVQALDKIDSPSRAPAGAFEEEVLTIPLEQKAIIQTLFAEDDAGVMKGIKDQMNSWDDIESYSKKWDLGSTHLYKTPSSKDKAKFITKNLLKYADKRFAGEVKNAEAGSAFHSVGKVEKSLRPNATVAVSKYINLKFKARVLQGKAIMEVRNPWIDCNATVSANGKMRVLTKKDFKQLGTSTGVEYNVNESQWIAFVDQEVTNNVKARLSTTTQSGIDADKRLEMSASFPFNL